MKTALYNPSPLEVEFAQILESLSEQISEKFTNCKITHMENNIAADNPVVRIFLEDKDGDTHHLAVKIIQKPDS